MPSLPVPDRGDQVEPAIQEGDCSLREATLNDFAAISEVVRRNGLSSPNYRDWARLWNENPFRSELPVPLGWVLENKAQGIVGTLSNIERMCTYNSEPVRVATASSWAVDPPYRTSAIFLAKPFFSQKNIDLFLNTTASPPAAAIFKAFRCTEIPDPAYTRVLFWIIQYSGFAGALLRKVRLPAIGGLRHAAGAALYCRDIAHRPNVRYRRMETCLLPRFDERFDTLWDALRRRRDRLLAVRTSETLTWQFRPALEAGGAAIVALLEGGALTGYLIMTRGDDEKLGLRRYRVVDIQSARDEPDIILSLMAGALDHARQSGVDVVEAVGFHQSKRDVLEKLNPHHRTYPACPYLYKVRAGCQELREALTDRNSWDPSLFDGDASL